MVNYRKHLRPIKFKEPPPVIDDEIVPIEVVSRNEWKAKRLRGRRELFLPAEYIRYGMTLTDSCKDRGECIKVLQEYQEYCFARGLGDQPYNFLVGGDGQIYEGRGWFSEAERPTGMKKLRQNSIDIGYIGNYLENDPPAEMVDAAKNYVEFGIKLLRIKESPLIVTLRDFRYIRNKVGPDHML